jgi:hopene-associated glycosyltransferase HpnB
VVVDDHSEDGTAAAACAEAPLDRQDRLSVLQAEPLPGGWTGKVWAMHQGVTRGIPENATPRYVLFSDADISHGRGAVRELVARAEANQLDLTSFMVRLQCRSAAERLMIPAFVFFFRLLYPFRRVNDPGNPLAGAAGGTMLVRYSALERIGGMAAIRREIIDDCSLAREIKRGGHRIWLGLSAASYSTRGYGTLREIVMMIARTAYTQLGYSPLRLLGCVFGLGLTFLAPPLLMTTGSSEAAALGGGAWLVMTLLYLPMVRFYRVSPASALLLPGVACVYLYATALSAWRHHRGKGGWWKGRSQSPGR